VTITRSRHITLDIQAELGGRFITDPTHPSLPAWVAHHDHLDAASLYAAAGDRVVAIFVVGESTSVVAINANGGWVTDTVDLTGDNIAWSTASIAYALLRQPR